MVPEAVVREMRGATGLVPSDPVLDHSGVHLATVVLPAKVSVKVASICAANGWQYVGAKGIRQRAIGFGIARRDLLQDA
jgi:hypothetical protein